VTWKGWQEFKGRESKIYSAKEKRNKENDKSSERTSTLYSTGNPSSEAWGYPFKVGAGTSWLKKGRDRVFLRIKKDSRAKMEEEGSDGEEEGGTTYVRQCRFLG